MESQNILEGLTVVSRRRRLLPWWIKCFIWIFLFFGFMAPIGIIFGLLGYHFQLSLYGIETSSPLSTIGILLTGLFLYKALVSYTLWTEKNIAITLGIVDALIGSAICVFMMFYPIIFPNSGQTVIFRLELLFLIPYFVTLLNVKENWSRQGVSLSYPTPNM